MGYSPQRFTSLVDDNLLCGICSNVLEDAMVTPCGHTFCSLCITTWLTSVTVANTCPECRGHVTLRDVRPVHSLRNLVLGLQVTCEHIARGCAKTMPLESMVSHLVICGHAPVECAGCGVNVDRDDLADHHKRCQSVLALSVPHTSRQSQQQASNTNVIDLSYRVSLLEVQLEKMRADLDIAETRNKHLDKELRKTRRELEEKRLQLLDQHLTEFDPEYQYGYTPKSITKLSCLVSRFLTRKPVYIDRDLIFSGIKRCYENYGQTRASAASEARSSRDYSRDVQVLLATANSSDWFSDTQRNSLARWLQETTKTIN